MKKNPTSKSGFFNPRLILAFALCSAGVCLTMLAFAAPTSGKRSTAQDNASLVKPTIISSTYSAVSPAVRDLPLAGPTGPRIERELPPVHPIQPMPSAFVDPAVQTSAPALATIPGPISTFEGQSSVDSAGGSAVGCICTPPDPNGAVGPTQYVQMVNSIFSVYDKTSGTRLSGPTPINSLFQTLPANSRCHIDNDGDPVVVYDQLADRWVLSQFAVGAGSGPTSSECIAISKTPDATGEYFIYDFDLGPQFEDYPHLGLWPDAYYMSTHEFSFASGNPFLGSAAWAFERDKMLAGQSARLVKFTLGSSANSFFGGHLPSNLDGFTLPPAGSPNYFAEADAVGDGARPDGAPAQSALDIWKFHVDWSNPLNSTFGNNSNPSSLTGVTNFFRPGCTVSAAGNCVPENVPQAGDPGQLDAIGDRLMYRNAYRNFGNHESLVLNHTVVAQIVMGHAVQMGPRWYEVRNPGGTAPLNPPVIFQQSTFGPTGQTDLLYRWMSSVAMDRMGDIAIGYSTSDLANFPSIAWAGQVNGLPLNTLGQGEAQMFAGTGPQHNELFIPFSPTGFGRWGDYTDMTVDPLDDCTFWYTNEYYSATDAPAGIWHTRIGSFKFPTCVPPALQLVGVVSRMTHGSITPPFDINLPLTPPRGVECRRSTSMGAGNYTLVFTFSNYLKSVGGAQVTAHDPATGTGTVITSVMGPGLKQYTVNLTNVSTGQYLTVTLNSVLDSLGNSANIVSPQMGVLVGDVNADGGASNLDVSLVKAKVAAGASVDSSNFRDDVNADGGFSNLDVSVTKAQVAAGAALPSMP